MTALVLIMPRGTNSPPMTREDMVEFACTMGLTLGISIGIAVFVVGSAWLLATIRTHKLKKTMLALNGK